MPPIETLDGWKRWRRAGRILVAKRERLIPAQRRADEDLETRTVSKNIEAWHGFGSGCGGLGVREASSADPSPDLRSALVVRRVVRLEGML